MFRAVKISALKLVCFSQRSNWLITQYRTKVLEPLLVQLKSLTHVANRDALVIVPDYQQGDYNQVLYVVPTIGINSIKGRNSLH